jgi:hypothetical protein
MVERRKNSRNCRWSSTKDGDTSEPIVGSGYTAPWKPWLAGSVDVGCPEGDTEAHAPDHNC